MSNQPKVSVIIPVYNDEPFLRQSLDSVLGQIYRELEILCVDDGSTDGSYDLLTEYARKDRRIKITRHEVNKGTLIARKTGVALAQGEWTLFLDADDTLEPSALKKAVKWVRKENADILQFTGSPAYEGVPESPWHEWALHPHDPKLEGSDAILSNFFIEQKNNTCLWGKLFRTSVCKKAFSVLPDMYSIMGEDIATFFFLALFSKEYRGVDGPALFHYYLGRGTSQQQHISLDKFREYCRMGELADYVKRYLDKNDGTPLQYAACDRMTTRMTEDCCKAWNNKLEGNKEEGLRLLGELWPNSPAADQVMRESLGLSLCRLKSAARAGRAENGDGPAVSVIIPVYNAEKHLRRCLDSVLNQTLREIEIICVDDGSTDSSPVILAEYAAKDDRVRVLRQENRYAGVARNAGMAAARGEYFAFLDADDFFAPELLEKQMGLCRETGAEIGVCGADQYDDATGSFSPMPWTLKMRFVTQGVFSAAEIGNAIFQFTTPVPWNKIFRRELVERTGLQFQDTRNSNDAFFVLCALNMADSIACQDEPLVHYRVGNSGSLQANNREAPVDFLKALFAVKDRLEKERLYERVKSGFVWFLVDNCGYTLSTIQDKESEAYRELCDKIRLEILPQFRSEIRKGYVARSKRGGEVLDLIHEDHSPLVSVVVPIYNTAEYLRRCLDSVAGQTLGNIEILCVIDGTTDNSEEIVREYARTDERFIVICQENRGLSAARNTGASRAAGKYLYFLDSDDYIELDALEYLYEEAERNELDLLLFDGVTLYESEELRTRLAEKDYCVRPREYSEVYSGETLYALMRSEGTYRPMTWLEYLRTDFFREANLAFREGIVHEDELFSAQSILSAKRVSHRSRQLYHYFRRDHSITVGKRTMHAVYSLFVTLTGLVALFENGDFQEDTWRSGLWHFRFLRENIVKGYDAIQAEGSETLPPMTELQKIAFAEVLGEEHTWDLPEPDTAEDRECLCYLLRGHKFTVASKPRSVGDVPRFVRKGTFTLSEDSAPDISIIIPVYNTSAYLRPCLDSVVGQTKKNIEIVCVNDGSTDDSLAVLEEYAARDPRISLVSQPNQGLSAARNAGVAAASGRYLYFLDSDDMIQPYAMDHLFDQAEKNELDLLYFDAETVFESPEIRSKFPQYDGYYRSRKSIEGVLPGRDLLAELVNNGDYRCQVSLQFIRRAYYDRAGLSFVPGILQEDNLYTFLAVIQAERTAHMDEALFLRRIRADSIMTVPVGFRNFYGYLRCGMGIVRFLENRGIHDVAETAGYQLAHSLLRQAASIQGELTSCFDRHRMRQLTPEETMWMHLSSMMVSAPAPLAQRSTPAASDGSESLTLFYQQEIERIHASVSYRIGRFLTWPARKARTFIRCIKEHGMAYTLKVYFLNRGKFR